MAEIPPEYRKQEPPIQVVTGNKCIVTGMGPTLMDDFLRARNHLKKGPYGFNVMGVNRSCQYIKTDENFTLDRDNAQYWRSVAINEKASWHSGQPAATRTHRHYPWIDYWWPMVQGSGTSAWGAAKVALMMGYEAVILAGCPLVQGPYADGVYAKTFQEDMKTIRHMQEVIKKDEWLHPHVRSMSGWTKKFLGGL